MRHLVNSLAGAIAIAAATYDADNTPAAVDLLGFEGVVLAIHVGIGGITFFCTNKIEFKLTTPTTMSPTGVVYRLDVRALAVLVRAEEAEGCRLDSMQLTLCLRHGDHK